MEKYIDKNGINCTIFKLYSELYKKNNGNLEITLNEVKGEVSKNPDLYRVDESLNEGVDIFGDLHRSKKTDVFGEMDDDDVSSQEKREEIKKKRAKESKEATIALSERLMKGLKYECNNENLIAAIDAIDELTTKFNELDSTWPLLTFLDVTKVTDFSAAFAFVNCPNADFTSWSKQVSNAKNMEGMFYRSTFNNDSILGWKTPKLSQFDNMFMLCDFAPEISLKDAGWITAVKGPDGNIILPEIGQDQFASKHYNSKKQAKTYFGSEEELKNIFKKARESQEAKKLETKSAPSSVETDDEAKRREDAEIDSLLSAVGGGEEVEESYASDYKFNYIMTREDFMVNEGIIDTIKNVVKNTCKKIGNWFLAFVGPKGDVLPVMSPVSTVNYLSKNPVGGVSVFVHGAAEECDSSGTGSVSIQEKSGWYGVKSTSTEKSNYKKFIEAMNNVSESFVSEERVGFRAEDGGLASKYMDVKTDTLTEQIQMRIENPKLAPLVIWGAPGIGKSTIPKKLIKAWNASKTDPSAQKTCIVVDCGQLKSDGFSVPIPDRQTLDKMLKSGGFIDGEIAGIKIKNVSDKWGEQQFNRTSDAVKDWLPMYKKSNDPELNMVMNEIANGAVGPKYDAKGHCVGFERKGSGGIFLMDEFLRADSDIFKFVMNLMLEREVTGGYVMGDKWCILACSNRPLDDDEVANGLNDGISPAGLNRVKQVNFVPDFGEWEKWATTEGGFDPITISFLKSRTHNDTEGGEEWKEYYYWHNIDPMKKKSGLDQTATTVFPTPRSWSMLMEEINVALPYKGKKISSIGDWARLRKDDFLNTVSGYVGDEAAEAYCKWMSENDTASKLDSKIDPDKIFNESGYTLPTEIAETTDSNSIATLIRNYMLRTFSGKEDPDRNQLDNLADFLLATFDEDDSPVVATLIRYDLLEGILGINTTSELNMRYPGFIDKLAKVFDFSSISAGKRK